MILLRKIYTRLRSKLFDLAGYLMALKSLPQVMMLMLFDKLNGRKIIVYHLSSPGHVQYHLPTFNELHSRKLLLSFYIAQDFPMQDKLTAFDVPSSHFYPSILSPLLLFIDAFIEGEIHGRGPKHAVKIFTGHGYPTKRAKWSVSDLKAFDVYFFYGPLEKHLFSEIIKQHPNDVKHIACYDVGYPKLDDLINGSYDKSDILSQLNLDPSLPTVLYAPAWDPGGALRTHQLKLPEYILSLEGINLIVKLHPANLEPAHSPNYQFYTGGVDWRKAFKTLENHPRFKFVDTYIINPLLAASDLLITDFSGVALEFMTQDKPVIFYECPEFYEKTLPQEGCDPLLAKYDDRFNAGRRAGTVVETFEEMNQYIQILLNNPHQNASLRAEMTQKFLYNPGKGTQFEANTILNLLSLPTQYTAPLDLPTN